MTKAPRVNGVSERTSPVKSLHHHHHNGGDSSTVLENGFHETTTKTNNSSIIRSKKEVNVNVTAAAGDDQPPAPLLLNGLDQSSPVSLNISGSSSSKSGSYLSPNQNRSPINSNAPLYKVIDKSMSYTKSPQLLSPGSAAASQQSRVQSPTTLNVNVATRSPNCQGSNSITKTPAEEVKSNRRGTGQPLSPVSSPLKSPPLLSSSATTRGDPGKRSKQLRKTELSLLNDEAENFMFPKAKEEDLDSDSSDVIVIVKGKKKTKAKQTAEASVDDRTMALIKQEMGEEGEGEGDEEEEEVFEDAREEAEEDDGQGQDKTSIAKAVNLLPLKKRFGASKAAKKATETSVASKNKKKLKAVPKKGGKLVKEEEEEEVEVEVPPVLPKETQKKKKKAAPKTKKGSQPEVVVVVKEEPKDEEEEEEEEVTLDQEEITKPVRRRKPKKETAKERRKREKLEKELNAMVKMEQDELEQHLSSDQLEEFSNLTLLMETEEMTRFQFAFERVPSLEPWYAPFHRQDEGQERIFEYYGSTSEYKK